MARLFTDGVELNSLLNYNTGGTGTPVTTPVTNGAYSIQFDAGQGVDKSIYIIAGENRVVFQEAKFRFSVFPDQTVYIMRQASSGLTIYFAVTATGICRCYTWNGSSLSQVGGDGPTLLLDTWYRMGLRGDAPGDTISARVDDSDFVSAASAVVGVQSSIGYGLAGMVGGSAPTSGTVFMDDNCVNDDTGSIENSWPGDCNVIHLRPDAAGDNAQWTRRGTDSGANWSQVDEVTPNDDTDKVQEDTSGNIDDYNLDATPAALASDDVINAVQVGVRYRAVLGLFSSDFVLRIKVSSGGTVEEGSTIIVSTVNFRTHRTSEPFIPTLTLYDLPGASVTAWTKADLDAAQIGQRCTETSAAGTDVTTIWLTVDHKGIGRPWASPTPPLPLIRREVVAY